MLSYNTLKKNLKKDFSGLPVIRLAVLADSAPQLLAAAVRAWGYEAGRDIAVYDAPYDQAALQLFVPGSDLHGFNADFIYIDRCTERALEAFGRLDTLAREQFADSIIDETRKYIGAAGKARMIINTFPEVDDSVYGNFAGKVTASFIYQLRKVNLGLMDLCRAHGNIFICDTALLQAQLGRAFSFDARMYASSGMAYSLDFLPYLAKSITDIMLAATGCLKKCLVLDLDNTLWGGTIGDDGLEGIELGHLGLGRVYTGLQLWARQLRQRGIILAVCSKNTAHIALEPFTSHPDMVLGPEDIAVFVANWESKVDNLRQIQATLNIGFDSMVFVDDNPFERALVRSAIPAITVPELPDDPAGFLPYLRSLNLFETASVTQEDAQRTQQYLQESERKVLHDTIGDEHKFLRELHMTGTARAADRFSIPRIAQLAQRSNQFNLRTVRYTETEIAQIAANPAYHTLALTLRDRFGDHGLTAVVILQQCDAHTIFIENWIMSCRVLKRGMEEFTLNAIVALARASGCNRITGEYLPTPKNGIVKDLYRQMGFRQAGEIWVLDVDEFKDLQTFIAYE